MILLRGSPEEVTEGSPEGITNALLRVLLRQSPESIMILLRGLLRGIPNALLRGSPEGVS